MEQITAIIENAYKTIAKNIYLQNYGYISDKIDDKSDASEAFKHINNGSCDIIGILYEMLDGIFALSDFAVTGNEHIRFADFYKDADAVETVSDENAKAIINDCTDENGVYISSQIKEKLYEHAINATWERMTELYYYYMYHNWYDKELEEAFREIVHEAIKNDDPIATHNYDTSMLFAMATYYGNSKEELFGTVFGKVRDHVYKELFQNTNLPKKYVAAKDMFYKHLDEDEIKGKSILRYRTVYDKNKKQYKIFGTYIKEAQDRLIREQYLSILSLYDKADKTVFVRYENFLKFFQHSFTVISGFRYDDVKEYFYPQNIILYTMAEAFCKLMNDTGQLLQKDDKLRFLDTEKNAQSALTISGVNTFALLNSVSKFYRQILLSHNPHNGSHKLNIDAINQKAVFSLEADVRVVNNS